MVGAKSYECIGGPWCGRKAPHPQPGTGFVLLDRATGDQHFYRLCVNTRRSRRGYTRATFWHYVGTEFDPAMRPRLRPHRRLYK